MGKPLLKRPPHPPTTTLFIIKAMGGAQVQSLTPTPPKHSDPLKGGGGVAGTKNTNRYLVPGLSFEGGVFNEQQTSFVPICPHGGERSMWPQKQKWLHKSCPLWGPAKMLRKN